MATTTDFIEYVCEQLNGIGAIRYRKMFGEYTVYVEDKPVVTVCNNTAFVKMLPCIADLMHEAEIGKPYDSAKEHYVLDIDNASFSKQIVEKLVEVTPLPKSKRKAG